MLVSTHSLRGCIFSVALFNWTPLCPIVGRQHTSPAAPTTSTAALAQEGMWEYISSPLHRGGPNSPIHLIPTNLTPVLAPPTQHVVRRLPCLFSHKSTHTFSFINKNHRWSKMTKFLISYTYVACFHFTKINFLNSYVHHAPSSCTIVFCLQCTITFNPALLSV